ncbi:TRAPP II complex [Gongronella butleri]|nr:TRAPP II complex [Gongronella butleri]
MDLDANLTSTCRIPILVVPILPVKHSVFTKYLHLFYQLSTVRLKDITPDENTGDQAMFSSQAFQDGVLHFKMLTHYAANNRVFVDMQPHRRLFGIIGIMDCREWQGKPLNDGYRQFLDYVQKFPAPMVTRCFAFDPMDSQTDDTKGVIMIPNVGDTRFYLNTMLCDFASEILTLFSTVLKDLSSQFGNQGYTDHAKAPAPLAATNDLTFDSNALSTGQQTPDSPNRAASTPVDSNSSAPLAASKAPPYSRGVGELSKNKKQAPGRVKKLHADFYLLAGRLPDAIRLYKQAMDMTRITADYLWLASALEGYVCATLLMEQLRLESGVIASRASPMTSSNASDDQQAPEKDAGIEPWMTVADILETYTNVAFYYTKEHQVRPMGDALGHVLEGELDASHVTAIALAETCLKVARFMLTVYLHGQWDKEAIALLVHGILTRTSSSVSSTPAVSPTSTHSPEDTTSASPSPPISPNSPTTNKNVLGIERWDIGSWVNRIWDAAIDRWMVAAQIQIMSHMIAIYSQIQYHRKAARLSYETLQRAMPFILNGQLGPKRTDEMPLGSIHHKSLLATLKMICCIYGAGSNVGAAGVLDALLEQNDDTDDSEQRLFDESLAWHRRPMAFGWPAIQMLILRHCITMSEALQEHKHVILYGTLLLKNYYSYIVKEEQIRLANTIQRLIRLKTSGEGNMTTGINYWGVNLVALVRLQPPIARRAVHQHASDRKDLIESLTPAATPISAAALSPAPTPGAEKNLPNDPFIYNPYASKVATMAEFFLVKDEVAEFQVTLVNPFGFDLELQSIRLSTSGVEFSCFASAALIHARRSLVLTISGVPSEPGELLVHGCFIKILGFAEQEFRINCAPPPMELQAPRLKSSGLSVRARASFEKQSLDIVPYKLRVIDEQPLMKCKSTSLMQNAAMLLEGETKQIKLTLENIGTVPVDYIALQASDNAEPTLGASMDMPPAKMYDFEQTTLGRKAIEYQEEPGALGQLKLVPPGATLSIDVNIHGKPGCSQGTLEVDYGHLKAEDNDNQGPLDAIPFFTRKLTIPLLISVYQPLYAHHWDLLHVHAAESLVSKDAPNSENDENDKQGSTTMNLMQISHLVRSRQGYCLAMLDLQNRWSCGFQVTFTIDNSENDIYSTNHVITHHISPWTTNRILLPIKRISLPDTVTSQPIPLATSQKVFSADKGKSEAQQRVALQMFWYREHLLKRIRAEWRADDGRQGILNLRSCLHVSPSQLLILKQPDIDFDVSIVGATQIDRRVYQCHANESLVLHIKVKNQYVRPMKLLLRVHPAIVSNGAPSEPIDNQIVLLQGLGQTVLPAIAHGEIAEHTIPLICLGPGQFDVLCHAQDVLTRETFFAQERTVIHVSYDQKK